MLLGDSTTHLDIVVTEVEPPTPHSRGGDVLLSARVRYRDFGGATETWVLREAWDAFIGDLRTLDERRQGEARLESISPGELRLRFFALDRAGHVAVEGEIGTLHHMREAFLRFGPVAFDPPLLPSLVRELAAAVVKASAKSEFER
jgi:hypothetical protein